jgi:hypothetical protein
MNQYNNIPTICSQCGATIPHSVVGVGYGFTYAVTTCPTCSLLEEYRQRHLVRLPIQRSELRRRPRPDGSPNAEALRELRESYGYFEKKEEPPCPANS